MGLWICSEHGLTGPTACCNKASFHNQILCAEPGSAVEPIEDTDVVRRRLPVTPPASTESKTSDTHDVMRCPFCGAEPITMGQETVVVRCQNCPVGWMERVEWNKRDLYAELEWAIPKALANASEETSKSLVCEMCGDSGFYGDNGPGKHGNSEWQFCECRHGCAQKLMEKIGGPYGKGDLICIITDYVEAVEKESSLRYKGEIEGHHVSMEVMRKEIVAQQMEIARLTTLANENAVLAVEGKAEISRLKQLLSGKS